MNAQIQISNVKINRTDSLYSLNDLHKASGGEARHKPSNWIANKQTIELIKEIEKDGKPSISKKQRLGTFVCRELVISYGMWISPAFALKVIQCFLDREDAVPAPHEDTLTPTQIRRVSEAVADLSRISLETTQSVYARLHRRFAVAQTAHIRAADYAEAMRFLGFPDTAPAAPAAPEPKPAIDGAALHGLASMLYYGAWSIEMGKDASEPLRRLGCPKGITMWTVWSETRRLLSQSCRTLETLADMLPADSGHKPYITEALADIRRTAKNCMI